MPLNPIGAKSALNSLFSNPVDNEPDAITQWKTAIQTLTENVFPTSTTVPAAATTLASALSGFNAPDAAAGKLETALTTFAVTVGNGMAPAYIATPPFGPSLTITFPVEDNSQAAANAIIDTINAWLKTGTAVPSGGGSPINWF